MEKTGDSETTGILALDSLASMDDDGSLETPERSGAVQKDVLSVYFDADSLCYDQVIKRAYKLKELLQCEVFCQSWYPWIILSETEEQNELERHVKANERSNMSAQPKATPT